MLKYNIRTRSLADQGAIKNVLAVEDDVVPFDRADVRVSGRSVRFCTLSGAFLTSVEVPIERRAVDTKLLRHLTC